MHPDSTFDQYGAVMLVLAWLMVSFFFPAVGAIIAGLVFGTMAVLYVINHGWDGKRHR
jgi:hypothetical protein